MNFFAERTGVYKSMNKKVDKKIDKKGLAVRTGIVFVVILLLSSICFRFMYQNQEKEGKLNATYTAEATVRKVETQISRYLENSDLFKNIISSGCSISNGQFADLAGFMKKNKNVIEAYELAPNGIISQVYPYQENKEAIGLNMLELSERKTEALLAKKSRKYTMAGPYELKQGGTGALIFDSIYVGEGNRQNFWGFSILVLNWENFLKELQITKLENAGYHFDVWKKNAEGHRIDIMSCGHGSLKNTAKISCSVPNDTWYFEIVPEDGWISVQWRIMGSLLSILIAIFLAIGYWQTGMRKYRESAYAEKLEESAKKAQKANEAKTRFLFNMSHDIRTPMNAIVGYSNLLEDSLDNREVAMKYIKKIKSSNSMLLSLINYILEMARIESGKVTLKKENENLQRFMDVLKAVCEPQIQEKKLDFAWKIDVEHADIICDITKVREIVLNIVTNAMKYTPKGGKITFFIKELSSDKEGYASYIFVVEDNGIGMHKEYLPHIFEEFSRERTSTESKVAGVGLGLPIVKSLVDMMDGRIEVESELNKGTKFSIFLTFPIARNSGETTDIAEQGLEKSSGGSQNTVTDLSGKRVLLVEDNELNAEIAMELLTRQGLYVDLAEDGQRCIEILNKMPEQYYDVILMDIQMPVMDGYETTMAIRRSNNKNAEIPIIAMTANAFEEDREHALEAGMNGHIAKPIDIDKVLTILGDSLLHKS